MCGKVFPLSIRRSATVRVLWDGARVTSSSIIQWYHSYVFKVVKKRYSEKELSVPHHINKWGWLRGKQQYETMGRYGIRLDYSQIKFLQSSREREQARGLRFVSHFRLRCSASVDFLRMKVLILATPKSGRLSEPKMRAWQVHHFLLER